MPNLLTFADVKGSGPLSGTAHSSGGRLRLLPEQLAQLRFLAEMSYPFEACGLLVGTLGAGGRNRVRQVFQTRNVCEFGKARRRYVMDPGDFLAADRVAREQEQEIIGIWHSHPNCPAEPSAADLESAWSGYSYVIVSVDALGDTVVRSWRLNAAGRWRREQIETVGVEGSSGRR